MKEFEPEYPSSTPDALVKPVDILDSDVDWKPLSYYLNGIQRHHEKLNGMAGNWMQNK
jgi:hypothetical protein